MIVDTRAVTKENIIKLSAAANFYKVPKDNILTLSSAAICVMEGLEEEDSVDGADVAMFEEGAGVLAVSTGTALLTDTIVTATLYELV